MTNAPRTVLLVDDDKFLLDMYSMKFTKEGYTVQSFLSVNEALQCLRQGFAPDAILFDLIMPEQDGFSFLESMRTEHLGEKSRKIALTNQSTDAERAHAMELGADLYLIKATMIPSEVVHAVGAALAQ